MSTYNKEFGGFGEKAAVKFLKKKGYKILETNFNTRFGELDIICEKDDILIIAEVKTRSSDKFGTPAEAVTPQKIKHIERAARYYVHIHNIECLIRFDIIEVYAEKKTLGIKVKEINHIEDAFWL